MYIIYIYIYISVYLISGRYGLYSNHFQRRSSSLKIFWGHQEEAKITAASPGSHWPNGAIVASCWAEHFCLPQFAWRNTCNNAVFLGGMTQNQASSRKSLKIINPLSPGGLLKFGHPWPSLGWSFGGSSHWAGHFDHDDLKFPIRELAPYYINIYCIYITYTHSVCIYIYTYT